MAAPAIRVQALGKDYRIGALSTQASTLGEILLGAVTSPFRRARRLLGGDASAASELSETYVALRDLSFEIAQGEVVGIIGRNGAGKTTLLRILSRITEPTRGEAVIRGRVGSLLEVGTGFHPELTGRENVYLNGAILGMARTEINARFDEIVDFSGVGRFLDTPVKHYSSGMYLRLAFAVAAHMDPEILLVDEVLAVGDAEFQRKCLSKMEDVGSSGRTVLFVSHNMAAVENLCSRAIWIDDGLIAKEGDPSEVISTYLGSYGQGSTATDLSDCPSRRGSGEIRFSRIEFLTVDENPVGAVRSGEPVRIRLFFDVHEQVVDPHFGINFHTALGTRVTCPNTWASGYSVPVLELGEGSIDLVIDTVYLMPGRYYLSLWCSPYGQNHYDDLEMCSVLDVEPSDYYGSGRGIDAKFGITFFPCHWSLGDARSKGE